ncbi:hypothetical protein LTR78_001819 [Recurvomyces mirabilis]|uniref:SIS domain-containing protein n=1 Tax=Recurvomyces mirabilis TaxID=574656 RepID=A0AAE0WUS9_9PEZI|nr:hypothetical protein LTR78_001819 [Recurvomyces mirabilis]KAK5156740.1 hypothetical protein LTS14_004953 [Recurvomyces mirabilis]
MLRIDEFKDDGSDVASSADMDDPLNTPPATENDLPLALEDSKMAAPSSKLKSFLDRAVQILATEAAALAAVKELYRTSTIAQQGLRIAVDAILETQRTANKLVICGVGKSAYIAQKLTATCKSLSIRASFLHACEAVHGDLGDVRAGDVLLGKTPELLNLLPHLPAGITTMALSSHLQVADCPLLCDAEVGILLPAPIPEREETTFGVAAPTTSTTVALAVADMLALTVADEMHRDRKDAVFKRNHPGGAIGINERAAVKRKRRGEDVVALELPSPSISGNDDG